MLDVIQSTGESKTRKLFLVQSIYYPLFQGTYGLYEPVRFLVVATATYGTDGNLFDWAAYYGMVSQETDIETAKEAVSRHGDKLSIRDVKFYLHGQPDLAKLLKRYRD